MRPPVVFTEEEAAVILMALGYFYGGSAGELGPSPEWTKEGRARMRRLGGVVNEILVKFGGDPMEFLP